MNEMPAGRHLSAARPILDPQRRLELSKAVNAAIAQYDAGDFAGAFQAALPYAELGHPEAQKLVGNVCAQGRLGHPDFAAAREWWQRAALQGDSVAQKNLATSYLDPDAGAIDVDAARTWFIEASLGGDETAAFHLGTWLLEHCGSDFARAAEGYYWLQLAALRGEAAARMVLRAQLVSNRFQRDPESIERLHAEALRMTAPYRGIIGADLLGQADREEQAAYVITSYLLTVAGLQGKSRNAFTDRPDKPSPLGLADDADILRRRLAAAGMSGLTTWILTRRGVRHDDVRCVPMSASKMWELARPGDEVDLTDGVNAHVTTVWSIDRDRGVIRFLDVWPDECLLLPGLNVLGVEATVETLGISRKLLCVRRDEFLLVVRGISGLVRQASIEALWSAVPEIRTDATAVLALAITLMECPDDESAARGLGWVVALLRGTAPGVPPSRIDAAADRAWVAAEGLQNSADHDRSIPCAILGVDHPQIRVSAILDELAERWPPTFDTLGPRALAAAILRRGHPRIRSSARSNVLLNNDEAGYDALLRLAVTRYPESEHLCLLRAERDLFCGRAQSAASQFADINDRLEAKLREPGPLVRDIYGVEGGEATNRDEITSALVTTLTLQARALFALGEPDATVKVLQKALSVSGRESPDLLRLLLEAATAAGERPLAEATKARLVELGKSV